MNYSLLADMNRHDLDLPVFPIRREHGFLDVSLMRHLARLSQSNNTNGSQFHKLLGSRIFVKSGYPGI